MKELLLTTKAVEDLKWWLQTDKRIALKVVELTYFFANCVKKLLTR